MPKQVQMLIRRARELTALAEKATPGPWSKWLPSGAGCFIIFKRLETWPFRRQIAYTQPLEPPEEHHNARLIAAAPEMACLLAEMADVLERLEKQLDIAAKEISTTPDGDMCPSDYDGELTCTCNGTIADVYRCWRERWRQKASATLEGGVKEVRMPGRDC